jgi:hypothetical protein
MPRLMLEGGSLIDSGGSLTQLARGGSEDLSEARKNQAFFSVPRITVVNGSTASVPPWLSEAERDARNSLGELS